MPTTRSGFNDVDRRLDAVLAELDSASRAGQKQFVFRLPRTAPAGLSLDAVVGIYVQWISAEGHAIQNVQGGGWSREATLFIRPGGAQPTGRSATAPAAASAPVPTDESLIEDVSAAVARYRRWFRSGDLQAIWSDRDELERQFLSRRPRTNPEFDEFEKALGADRFWVNAFPAFAGLELGYNDPAGPVFMYAGNADASVDRADDEQAAMMQAVDERAHRTLRG